MSEQTISQYSQKILVTLYLIMYSYVRTNYFTVLTENIIYPSPNNAFICANKLFHSTHRKYYLPFT